MDKEQAVIDAINVMKTSSFGLTGVKVELEAQLNRRNNSESEACEDCVDGSVVCRRCNYGILECGDCSGTGSVANLAWVSARRTPNEPSQVECESCGGNGELECSNCDGTGNAPCLNSHANQDWLAENVCHDFILERLVPLGLAQLIPRGATYSYARKYRPVLPLVFSKFYRDGSVDSEHTFTLSVEDPRTVLLLPKFIEIFNDLAKAVGGGMDVGGAGMHMAFLNSEGAYYPNVPASSDIQKFRNFRKSMILLLPALYFLGTGNETSRGLNFRRPQIESNDSGHGKYHAVNYGGGAVEFRVFDTCYDKPEVILDNIIVMANAMKYWRATYKSPGLEEICQSVDFGNDKSDRLDRFYCKKEHIDLLNKGLTILKPSYYTVNELKQQRNFCVTKKLLEDTQAQKEKEIENEYKEYENRFDWKLVIDKNRHMTTLAQQEKYKPVVGEDYRKKAKEVEKEAARLIKEQAKAKKPMRTYIAERKRSLNEGTQGQYTLAV